MLTLLTTKRGSVSGPGSKNSPELRAEEEQRAVL
jgi:hypothetical protein